MIRTLDEYQKWVDRAVQATSVAQLDKIRAAFNEAHPSGPYRTEFFDSALFREKQLTREGI